MSKNKQLTEDDFIRAGMDAAERKKAARIEAAIIEDGCISAASLPEKFQVKDVKDPDFLITLPKEALVAIILKIYGDFEKFLKACS